MKHALTIFVPAILSLIIGSCSKNNSSSNVTITSTAADGLDLKAVTQAVKTAKDAEELEKVLNTPGNKINNLDLDEDNLIDYIKVTEINQDNSKGFSLTVELSATEEQEVCTVQIEQDGDNHARVQTHGNSHIYGHNHYYYQRSALSDILMWHYLSSSIRPYRSSYGFNNHPRHFSQSAPIPKSQYSGFHSSQPYAQSVQKTNTKQTASSFNSPNKNKVASNIKAPLRNPTTSQKSFQRSHPSRSVTSARSSRYGSSGSSRSGSSFGGGK